MNKIQQAYNKLNGHFPTRPTAIFYKGQRITKKDFKNIKNKLDLLGKL